MQSKKQIAGPLGAGTSSVEAVRAAWTCEDGSRAATITEGGASRKSFAQVWEIDRGTTIGGEYTAPEGVVSAQLDRSGETLVLRTERAIDFRGATRESEVQLWDVNTHRQRGTTLRHNDDIKSAVISPNGEFVATQSQAAIRIWNVSNGEPVTPPVRHQGPLRGAAFSPDSRHIATFGSGDIRVWDLATAEVIAPLVPGYDSSLTNAMLCAMLPDEQRALSVDLWQTQVWNARTGQMLHSIRSPAATLDARFEPSRGQIVTLGEITSARGRTCNITVHDAHLEKSVIIKSISGLPDARCICLFPSGRQIAIGTPNGEVRLVDLVSGSSVRKPFQQQGDILQIAVSKDERFVAAVGTADVTLWDLKLAGRIPLKGRPQAGAKVVSLAPATPLLAIGTGRYGPGDVFVFEIPSGDLKFGPFAFQDELSALCFSEDGALLAAASRDGSARIWSMSDGLPITPFLQHGAAVNDISFYGSRPLLITAAGDSAPAWKPGGVRIWDARTGASVGPVLRHHLEVGRASTGRQGHVLFSAGSDVARLWDISQDERSDDDLILTGQLYGDHKIDASGAIVPLGPDDRRTRWAAICQRREAENGDESRQRALRWHRKRAHENELAANWKLASEHLDRVIAEESPDSVYYGRRAHANFQLGHSSACLDDCDRAIQLGANDTLIHHYRGCALSWMKRSSEALREHEMAARIANAFDGTVVGSDWRLELILWVASAQAELDRANEAARTLSAVPEALMSNCVWEFEQFAQRQRQARNWRSVVATLNPLAAEFRDESKYFIQRAEALTMLRQWERAEADYLAVVRLDPRNGDAFESMGDVRAELGRFEEAADAYQSAVERGNNRLSVGLNWTAVLAMTNRTQQYLENADQLMNLAERTKSAANRQAVVAALIGRDLDEQRNVRLLRIAQRCANEDPNTPWPMALLGAAQYRTKHYFLAAGILAPLVSETITPTPDPATFYFMALVNCWLGQSEIANRQFQQAKERAANSGQTVDWQTRARWNLLRQEVRQHLALDERRPVVAPRPDRAKRS
jgi:WD40 repeat protein